MESLFKLTELESRIPLNMNVLVKGRIPKVIGLAEVLREWLDHRRDVLLRRSNFRLRQIEHRLEVLGGYLVAYLNLDKVIKIIRNEDEPKPVLMKTFKLTDVQADAILNMRLRNLRKLEEMEIRNEDKDAARREARRSRSCSAPRRSSGSTIADEIKELREKFGQKTPLGKRRTRFRRSARARRGGDRRGDGRARADHGRGLREGLDARAARPRRPISRTSRSSRTTSSSFSFFGRDDLEVPDVRHQRPLLHHRGRQASGRSRPRRAGAPVHRPGAGSRPRRDVPLSGRAQVPGREPSGQGLHRRRGRSASPTPARASRCST